MVHTQGRQTMIEWGSSRLERLLAEHGERWEIEHEGLVWTATEHPSSASLHVLVAYDLDELERKIIDSELRG
jgi:hypothetical protein